MALILSTQGQLEGSVMDSTVLIILQGFSDTIVARPLFYFFTA
ncbi:hypothetical protein MTR67_006692 [Solanum verrucosum]|uniref:Uncharacterized protein n=1 Tax=Solanum verrucosum TaxID=315347 RepID=A0AAF0PYQ9_SOLVR|nr:hypothetical protein MTR67_006692 [Solanum verrucosum]